MFIDTAFNEKHSMVSRLFAFASIPFSLPDIDLPPPEDPCPRACAASGGRRRPSDSKAASHSPYTCTRHVSRAQYTCHPSPEDEVGVEVAAEVVDGEVLAVQAHVGEEVELVAVVVEDEELLLVPRLGAARQLLQTPLLVLVPAQDHVGLGLDTHELEYFRVKQVYNNNIQNYSGNDQS